MSDKSLSLKKQPTTKQRNKKPGLILSPQWTRAFMKVSLPVAQLEIQTIERK